MEVLKPLITDDEFYAILAKERLTKEDVFKLCSYTPYTLVEKIGDLKNEELNEVYYLETKNVYAVLSVAGHLFGIFDNSKYLLEQICKTEQGKHLLQNINYDLIVDAKLKQGLAFRLFAIYMLSGLDVRNEPQFEGKIPKKMFSFRQMSAEEWFKNYVNFVTDVASRILNKSDAENTFMYLLINTAWYANKSQTFKYYKKSTDKNLEETLIRITREYIRSIDINSSFLNNTPTTTLFKDL